jgi:hypothetical protein
VTWTNHDNVPHVLSSTDNQFKKSTVLKAWRELFPHLRDHGNLLLFLCHPLSNDRENHRQVNIKSDPLHEIIASLTSLILFEGRTLIIQLALCFRGSAVAQPEEIDSSPGLARPIRLGNARA